MLRFNASATFVESLLVLWILRGAHRWRFHNDHGQPFREAAQYQGTGFADELSDQPVISALRRRPNSSMRRSTMSLHLAVTDECQFEIWNIFDNLRCGIN
jgi:hypothetical protein